MNVKETPRRKMAETSVKAVKSQYLCKDASEFNKNLHIASFCAYSAYSRVSAILKSFFVRFFSKIKMKNNATKFPKPNNFSNLKTRVMKINIAHLYMLRCHTVKL